MIALRPDQLFDRESEWDDLAEFAIGTGAAFRIGVVYGRRRQGKTFLLRNLVRSVGGFYHQALEEEREPAMGRLGAALAADLGLGGGALALTDWREAIRRLPGPGDATRLVVLDEFPYLLAKSPELASAIQIAYDEWRDGQHQPMRLILCGSAMSIMTQVLAGQKAMRGRATLDLVLRPFDYRTSAAYWGIEDPELALLVDAVVGGTPGYRALLDFPPPVSVEAFGRWLARGVLNPSHAMFHEADYLLTEEPSFTDRALYQSALSAIADGRATPGAIAAALGRPETSINHVLSGLQRAHFVEREEDALRLRRPRLRVADPFLRFYFNVIRPELPRFEERRTEEAWAAGQERWRSNVLGPHFENLARYWTLHFASEETLGGRLSRVGATQVSDTAGRSLLELDVAAVADEPGASGRPRLLLIGEAKFSDKSRGLDDLRRLERARELLGMKADVASTRLALFSRRPPRRELLAAVAGRGDVILVDLERLYRGS